MASNVSRGAAAKGRTKKWLASLGFQVADLEKVHWIFTPKGRIPIKRDQFGSDLLAMDGAEIVFVQVKSGESARTGTFPAAQRLFASFLFPPFVRLLVVAWPPRARTPRVLKIERSQGLTSPTIPPAMGGPENRPKPSGGDGSAVHEVRGTYGTKARSRASSKGCK